jgi:hypothetical protein
MVFPYTREAAAQVRPDDLVFVGISIVISPKAGTGILYGAEGAVLDCFDPHPLARVRVSQ